MAQATPTDVVSKRYDFVLLFDVQDGNPNGDPDAGNLPRIDPQSPRGIVTGGCIKRKIRNAISVLAGDTPGNELHFRTPDASCEKRIPNLRHRRAHAAAGPKGRRQGRQEEGGRHGEGSPLDVPDLPRHPRVRRGDDHRG